MRVALDGQPLLAPLAGVGHYTRQLVQALARLDAGHRYYVLTPYPLRIVRRRAPRLRAFDEPNVELRVPSWWATARARLRRRLGHEADLRHGIEPPPDVFHATNNVFPYRVRAAGRVLTIHDLTLLLFPEWHPADRLARMVPELEPAVARAQVIITPSCATRNDVLKLLPADPERVRVVPHGVDAAFTPRPATEVAAALDPLRLRAGEYLLFLGTIEPRKNLLRLLEAMELLDPAIGPLVLAGGHGWNDGAIRAALERLERAGRVRALGYVADELRPVLLTGARAFVYPSLYEGFGWPPLEAMACGTPVVTTNVSSLPEVVGDAALFVSPDDVDGLAAALSRVWQDEPLRADLRARGLARARQFSWERTARLTLDAYHAALSA
jgi:O-antigen biosynthesis alpha-1,3-rhamnosyltransferase